MVIFSEKLSKYIGAIVLSSTLFLNNAFGERCIVSLGTFFDTARWEKHKANAQAQYGDNWREEIFKDPKKTYQACLQDFYKEKLNNTHLYILVSSYRQAQSYGSKVIESLEANAKHLQEFGVTPHIIVRCDGEKTAHGEYVIFGDLRKYADCLDMKKIAFKVHASESVNPSDFNYEHHNPEAAHWELVANETNLGCSRTRHASIDMIEEETKELLKGGKCVYIGIFDGDDWVHEDYYPVLVLNALYANARISNYNGRMGAHGLENTVLREKRMLGIGAKYTWTVYTDMTKDNVSETLSEEYKASHPNYCGVCCTTKIFEAGYLYQKLDYALSRKMLTGNPDAKRNWIDLTELSPLDGFGEGACTCTTPIEGEPEAYRLKGSLFHYTRH